MFGGYANYPLHFWASSRREAGGALPSSHAGAGYALLSLYFAGWAMGRPSWRWGGLALGIAAGLVFSIVRIMQGAHFFSQTVWSACIMWFIASLLFYRLIAGPRGTAAAAASEGRPPSAG
jgi:membrane-associated PAP2 superfamily phosphatase